MFIQKIAELFQAEQIPFALVGGYAVAIHGVARGTFDVDIITRLSRENFIRIEQVLQQAGLRSTIPVSAEELFDNLEQFKADKNLIVWNFSHPEKVRNSLDILITEDISKYSVINAETGFGTVQVLDIESIIRLKEKADRPQDREDIAALRKILRKK